jgi:hypothetical protein
VPLLPSEFTRYSLENAEQYFSKCCQHLQNKRDSLTVLYPEDGFGTLGHICTNAVSQITEDRWPDLHNHCSENL